MTVHLRLVRHHRLLVHLPQHREGEPVHLGDRVVLESVASGLCLCISMGTIAVGFNRVPRRDVFGGALKDAAPLSRGTAHGAIRPTTDPNLKGPTVGTR